MNDLIGDYVKSLFSAELKTNLKQIVTEVLDEREKIKLKKDLDSNSLMSAKQVAEYLKVSSVTVWNWTNSGILKCSKIGGRVRYVRSEVAEALIKIESKKG